MVWLSQKYPNCVPYGAQVGIHNMYVVLFSVPEGLDGMFYSNVEKRCSIGLFCIKE